MKRKIRIVTDITVSVIMLLSGLHTIGEIIYSYLKFRNHEDIFFVAVSAIMLTAAALFANDALCVISENHRSKVSRIESRFKILPIIAVIIGAFSIPVGAVTLFYAPLAIVSVILSLLHIEADAESLGVLGTVLAVMYIAADFALEASAFVSLHHIFEDRNDIVSHGGGRRSEKS